MTARPTNASYFEQPHLNEFGYIIRLVPDDEPQPQPTAQNGKPHRPRLTVRTLDTYQTRAVEWLDKPFLQRSAFHVLAGRKGSCKGTYLCGLAARVTSGDLYPEPKRVLVVTSEDSIELDFRPRVLAAAGDPRLVTIVNGPFRMPADLDWLKRTALELGNVGLIIIDPIGNHLNGADTDKEGQVRDAIAPLNETADELELMVFGARPGGGGFLAAHPPPAHPEGLCDVGDRRARDARARVVPADLAASAMATAVEAIAGFRGKVDSADEGDAVVDHDRLLVVAVHRPLLRIERAADLGPGAEVLAHPAYRSP